MSDTIDRWQAFDGTWLEMRQMRPSDGPQVKASLNKLSASARRSRFFAAIAEFSDEAVHQLVAVDPRKEYLLVVMRRENDIEIPIGGGRFVQQDDCPNCAFSLLVGDDWQGQGIGRRLLKSLVREASRRSLRTMYGHVLADNRPMLVLARSLRFAFDDSDQGAEVVKVARELFDPASQRRRGLFQRLWRR
ncbi:GNAT family N-acetyltransferase [Accumulibacter sp.]|uniref:GNAT family N-acetyltransferase n=1 Tax=Accumulibacter sp. TaxID=2053492 RepID=UPI0028C4D2EF|nr:GNAT family N-acetyltransferase [Accumulibacter sp.]